jgi:hypothetical protein
MPMTRDLQHCWQAIILAGNNALHVAKGQQGCSWRAHVSAGAGRKQRCRQPSPLRARTRSWVSETKASQSRMLSSVHAGVWQGSRKVSQMRLALAGASLQWAQAHRRLQQVAVAQMPALL